MAKRHEEKYLIDYRQYALLKQRISQIMTPDPHGQAGSYTITSLYYDDPQDTALYEKLDGLGEHTKFRIRTYDGSDRVIKLERKVKKGIITQKQGAGLTREQMSVLAASRFDAATFPETAEPLVLQMQAGGLRPAIGVRYRRDAFFYPGTDLRLTFDRDLEALSPEEAILVDSSTHGLPVLDGNTVILEIKYGQAVPSFLRKLTAFQCKQLSVSKYALCREIFPK